MNTYFALVHKDRDSAYGISFPDLPGCFSAADDEDDIFQQAQSALTLFASDEDALPNARTVSQLRADPDVRAEIAAGAFVIAVPLIIVTRKLRYNLMLDADLVEGVDATARSLGVSRSEFVSEAIGQRLKGQVGAVVMRQVGSGKIVSERTDSKVSDTIAKVATSSKAAKSAAASALTQKVKKK